MVSDISLAETACTSAKKDSIAGKQPHGHSFAILSASGTIHTPHFDPNGMGTLLYVHEGFKFFVTGEYEADLSALPPFPKASDSKGLWSIFEMDGLKLCGFVLGPHDAL